jgi:Na+-translocating ferredoxin:NAD+ oxidoreductase RnfC subunit
MDISISPEYHRVRLAEMRLTADYPGKVEQEKERVRAQRERQREEERAQREFEREKARLIKEQAHYLAVLTRVRSQGDAEAAADLESRLGEIAKAISGVEAREAGIRAGYVYVISNVGAFGPEMVKIGMTRRLEPADRSPL